MVSLAGGDRQIRVNTAMVSSGRFIFNGNITNDGTARNLNLQANQFAGIELGGNNKGVDAEDIVRSDEDSSVRQLTRPGRTNNSSKQKS